MLQQLFGTELAFPIRVAVALAVIASLLGVTVVIMRRLSARGRASAGRGRSGPRIAVLDSVAVDQRRKLVLVRRDEVEHLLLIGGNSDIVVEPQINAREETAPAATAAPVNFGAAALAPAREAPALQRSGGRQRLPGTSASALAAPAEATLEPVALPSTSAEPTVAEPAPAPAVTSPTEPAGREGRRPFLGRKPLLRGDGTMSAARPTRPATDTASEAPVREAPVREAPVREAPVPQLREAEPPRRLFSAEPKAEPKKAEPKAEPVVEPAPAVAATRAEPAPVAATPSSRLDAMAQRLDAALKDSAAPQLSLTDLLGDTPNAGADSAPAAKEEAAPAPVPAVKAEPEPASEPATERAPARFVFQSRTRGEAPRAEPRTRPDPLPRFDRPSAEPGERPAAANREPSPRPREFAFRQSAEPSAREEAPRREFSFLREPAVRTVDVKAPEGEAEPRKAPVPNVAAEARQGQEPHASEPPLAAPVAEDAPLIPPAPSAAPEPAVDPLDDFDAEMANLLGRNTARSR